MTGAKLGRVAADERGVRRKRWLGLFGGEFDLPWEAITAWATGADVIQSHEHPNGLAVSWVIEIDHARGTEVVRWGRGASPFDAFVAVVAVRLPGRRRPGRVAQRYDARLPEPLARIAGLHRDP